eukprot:6351959-Pyramimonas_sp.AAC.1
MPKTTLEAGFPLDKLDLVLRGPEIPTFVSGGKSSIIDYYMLSVPISLAISSMEVDVQAATGVHRPVYLHLKAVVKDIQVQIPVAFQKLTSVPARGPPVQPPSYEVLMTELSDLIARHTDDANQIWSLAGYDERRAECRDILDRCYTDWVQKVRTEILDATQSEASGPHPGLGTPVKTVSLHQVLRTKSYRKAQPHRAVVWARQRLQELRALFDKQPFCRTSYLLHLLRKTIGLSRNVGGPFAKYWKEAHVFWNSLMSRTAAQCLLFLGAPKSAAATCTAVLEFVQFFETQAMVSQQSLDRSSWKAWCEEAMSSTTGKAVYAYLKGRGEQSVEVVEDAAGYTSCLTSHLTSQTSLYSSIWNAASEPMPEPESLQNRPPMPIPSPVSEESIRKASSTFKHATCQPDGLHPRHFSMVSAGGRNVMASLFTVMDILGEAPKPVQNSLMLLARKHK